MKDLIECDEMVVWFFSVFAISNTAFANIWILLFPVMRKFSISDVAKSKQILNPIPEVVVVNADRFVFDLLLRSE